MIAAQLPPSGSRPLLKAGWAAQLHPRAAGGRFTTTSQKPHHARRTPPRPQVLPPWLVIQAVQGNLDALQQLKLALGVNDPLTVLARREADFLRQLFGPNAVITDINDQRVIRELASLYAFPPNVMAKLAAAGLYIQVGLGPVDSRGHSGVPRGYDATATYANVGGLYNPTDRTLSVNATIINSGAVITHELGHAVQSLLSPTLPPDVAAGQARSANHLVPYYLQPEGGTDEFYAESWRQFLSGGTQALARFADLTYAAWFAQYVAELSR